MTSSSRYMVTAIPADAKIIVTVIARKQKEHVLGVAPNVSRGL